MAELDIISLEEGQAAVKAFSATNAPDLEATITGISGAIDEACGAVVAREVTELVSGPYSGGLLLTSTPVLEVTGVVETSGVTPATLDEADWNLEADGHYARLFRLSGGYDSTWVRGRRNIAVTLMSGRFESTADVSYRWREGFKSVLIAKWQWEAPMWARNRGEMQTDDGGFPVPFNLDAAIRAAFPLDVLPPGIA